MITTSPFQHHFFYDSICFFFPINFNNNFLVQTRGMLACAVGNSVSCVIAQSRLTCSISILANNLIIAQDYIGFVNVLLDNMNV